ncbi:MAG: hypothetical protein ABJF23_10620, partial [Bryobacteraceae bacterium]
RFTLLFVLASGCFGQPLYFGVVGGTNLTVNFPTTDYFTPADAFGNPASHFQYLTGSRSFIFGATVEGRLSDRFSIEANVLHRPMKARIIFTEFPEGGASTVYKQEFNAVRAWEFPVLLKYSLPPLPVAWGLRPFLEMGPSFRTQEEASSTEPSQIGFSIGGGAAFQKGRIRIAPTLRYTRWAREDIAPKYSTKPDQLEFLTSISFQTDRGSRRVAGRKLEIGAVLGLPVKHGFATSAGEATGERAGYLAGLMAETNVAGNVSVEVNALYRPIRASGSNPDRKTVFEVLTWQFPVLAKYRWSRKTWSPFAEAGPSFRLSGNLNGYNPSSYGVTAGGGVETRARGNRLAPAIRYTRWARDASPYSVPGYTFDYPRTKSNSIEIVCGISF